LQPTTISNTFHVCMRNRFVGAIPELDTVEFSEFASDFQMLYLVVYLLGVTLQKIVLFAHSSCLLLQIDLGEHLQEGVLQWLFCEEVETVLQRVVVIVFVQQRGEAVPFQTGSDAFVGFLWVDDEDGLPIMLFSKSPQSFINLCGVRRSKVKCLHRRCCLKIL
jgi:hypothetical protein